MAITKTNTKCVTYDLAKFAGSVEVKQFPFYSFIKAVILLSVLFSVIMLVIR